MLQSVSHSRADETPEARACWFQSLTLEERADWLCEFTDLVLEINPKIMEHTILTVGAGENAQPAEGRVQALSKI